MKTQKESKSFAFKLAKKVQQEKPAMQWKVRDGVALAACTTKKERLNDNWIYC